MSTAGKTYHMLCLRSTAVTKIDPCSPACHLTVFVQIVAHAKSVLGYTVLGPVALLLVAEAVRVSAVLPGGHVIKTVAQSRWHKINLQVHGSSI